MALIAYSTARKSTPGACSPMLQARPQASAPDRRVRDPGDGMSWQLLVEFVVSIAYGVLSSLVPIFNSEIYIVAVIPLGIAVLAGRMLLFLAIAFGVYALVH